MEKSVLIIGGGVAGLCTGIVARMNGYHTTLIEMNATPGGLCTAWQRGDYTIDGCLHWFTGATGEMSTQWKPFGVIDQLTYIFPEEFGRVTGAHGKAFIFYTNIDKLEAHLIELAPEDTAAIRFMCKDIRAFAKSGIGLGSPEGFWKSLLFVIKIIPHIRRFRHYSRMTIEELANQFSNPDLREALKNFFYPQMSALTLLMMLAWASRGYLGYPLGGSKAFIAVLEKRFLELGGITHYNTKVTKIAVENNRAHGVTCENGAHYEADYIISAADGRSTIFEMLDGAYVSEAINNFYTKLPIFKPLVYVALGVHRTFPEIAPLMSTFTVKIPKTVFGDQEQEWLPIRLSNGDPSLAPQGKTVLTFMLEANYQYWKELAQDPAAFTAKKDEIVQQVVQSIEPHFPGISGQIEMTDCSTPLSFEKYTGNWQGSPEGWLPTPDTLMMTMDKTLPGLKNFYMVGQWVQPGGGLPCGLTTGIAVMKMICQRDAKKFVLE